MEYTPVILQFGTDAVFTRYSVFPGIDLVYKEICADTVPREGQANPHMLEITHCREGRLEYSHATHAHYLAAGDLDVRAGVGSPECCPTGRFRGLSVEIDCARAPQCLSCFLENVDVRPAHLMAKFCGDGESFIIRSTQQINHIFSELYDVPQEIRQGYHKLKVLELLLFLSALDPVQSQTRAHNLSGRQADLARGVRDYICTHLHQPITIALLSEQFHVSASALKTAFKSTYGSTVYAFVRTQRMQRAARDLRESERSVLEIAGDWGYENAGKFAAAFRAVYGVSPREYRNGADMT